MGTSSGYRDKPDAGRATEILRVDFQRGVLPDGTDSLQTERGRRSAAPEVGNAVDIGLNRVGAAARGVDRGYLPGAGRVQEVGRYYVWAGRVLIQRGRRGLRMWGCKTEGRRVALLSVIKFSLPWAIPSARN